MHTSSDLPYALTIFVALNIARAIAYWPQILSIYRDPGRASAVSLWTWIVFTAANIATVIYALGALEDLVVAAVFGVNAIGCAAIVMLTTYKRCRHRQPVWNSICAMAQPEPAGPSGLYERRPRRFPWDFRRRHDRGPRAWFDIRREGL